MANLKVVQLNPYNNTYDVGWEDNESGFTPYFCGFATKAEADAVLADFDARMQREQEEYSRAHDEAVRQQNRRFPKLAHVRSKISGIKDPLRALDAQFKLDWLLELDIAEHITWPLPSWKAIKSGRVYGYGR
jgi:hypothetical protein